MTTSCSSPAGPEPGETVTLRIENATGAAIGFVVFGSSPMPQPILPGCFVLVNPLLPALLPLPLGLSGEGTLTGSIPVGAAEYDFVMQAFVLGSSQAATNGIQVRVR